MSSLLSPSLLSIPPLFPTRTNATTPSIDWVQENVMGEGKQNNESAFEQAKDEQISDYIRGKYESTTGTDMPIQDKSTTLDKSKD